MAGLIIVDRDGVLNRMVVHPEHGTIDSPLHPWQVELEAGAAEAIARLTRAGFVVAIATNQPSAAKGKTTRENLEQTHAAVLRGVEAEGGVVASSHICFHRHEDGCACRKPKPGLLLEALARHAAVEHNLSWMVGDGVTDVEAGVAVGLQTAFLGPRKCDACRVMRDRHLSPTFWGTSLLEFVEFLVGGQN